MFRTEGTTNNLSLWREQLRALSNRQWMFIMIHFTAASWHDKKCFLNCLEIESKLLQSFKYIGCDIFLKINLAILVSSVMNTGSVPWRHFCMEISYQGNSLAKIIANYYRTLKRDPPYAKHRRISKSLTFHLNKISCIYVLI